MRAFFLVAAWLLAAPAAALDVTYPSGGGGGADGSKVAKTGDTMTGDLKISSATLIIDGNIGKLTFGTVGTGLFIDNAVNFLGVGNSAPAARLDVSGGAAIRGQLTVAGSSLTVGGALGANTLNTALTVVGSSLTVGDGVTAGAALRVSTSNVAGSAAIVTDSSNRVAIGDNSPTAKLDIDTRGGSLAPISISTGGGAANQAFYITAAGKVGFGTTAPGGTKIGVKHSEGQNDVFAVYAQEGDNPGTTRMVSFTGSGSQGFSEFRSRNSDGWGIFSQTTDGTEDFGQIRFTRAGGMQIIQGAQAAYNVLFSSNNATTNFGVVSTAGNFGFGTTSPGTKVHLSSGTLEVDGTNATTVRLSGTAGGCLMIEDTDEAGWTECDVLNGTMSCSTDADGVCD